MLAFVYEPGVTAVLSKLMVPVEVIGPPVKPVPVAMLVTEPEAGVAQVPSARRKLTVPPPEAETTPGKDELKSSRFNTWPTKVAAFALEIASTGARVISPELLPERAATALLAIIEFVMLAAGIVVTLPIEVTSPVKLAFVVTVAAFPVVF